MKDRNRRVSFQRCVLRVGVVGITLLVAISGGGVALSTIVGPQLSVPAQVTPARSAGLQGELSPQNDGGLATDAGIESDSAAARLPSQPDRPSWRIPVVGGIIRATNGGGSPVPLPSPQRFFSFIFGNVTTTPLTDCSSGYSFVATDATYGDEYQCSSANIVSQSTATGSNPTVSITNLNASATGGSGQISVAQYSSAPVTAPSFAPLGSYIDVKVAAGFTFTSLTVNDCVSGGASAVYWWNGAAWNLVSNQTPFVSGAFQCFALTFTNATSPSLSQLIGTPMVGGPSASASASPTGFPTGIPVNIPPFVATAIASGGGPTGPPSPAQLSAAITAQITQSFTSLGLPPAALQQVTQALTTAGLTNFTIPSVPPPGVFAAPADVPVPLATLNPGALVLPLNTGLTTALLSQIAAATAPVAVSAAVSGAQGGVIVAGNVAITLNAGALTIPAPPTLPGQPPAAPSVVQVAVVPQTTGVPVPGGPAQFSPNGTVLDIKFTDQATGNPITTFPVPITLTLRANAADVSQANGHFETLTGAYIVDATTPEIANPLHFPPNTFVIFAPNNVVNDPVTGTVTIQTQALGSTVVIMTNPVGYVQTLAADAPELSSFDPATSQTFGTKPQFSYLQVTEPQIGNRLLVLDPDTGNYSYVNATDVAPSGPPPSKTSAGVVRGLLPTH